MDTTELTYPVFEASQVLTSAHLNDLFDYLDEQQRLTRAHLIGIGIACGLEVELPSKSVVRLSRGVGVTSEGYLITERKDLDLVSVRPYTLPADDPYPPGGPYAPFVQPGTDPPEPVDLWELFPDNDEPGAQPLASSGLVLEDKALVLFLELRRAGLRNCAPNSCDDRGSHVTTTVRRLLVDTADLDRLLAKAPSLPVADPDGDRLGLPDLRVPRYDVPSSDPVETEEVLAGFQAAIREGELASRTADALKKLYAAFRPLLKDAHPTNPFHSFITRFGFLEASPTSTTQVHFLQYYWDLFGDLLAAYDEVRWAGVDLLCACAPPGGLFPRHLVAGTLVPVADEPDPRRTAFVASPAVGECEARSRRFRMLFDRLVAMVGSFTDTPSLGPASKAMPDRQIRVTPSRAGDAAVGSRAIPYYYESEKGPGLHRVWDPEKTERRRTHHNLGYRASKRTPPPPDFVANPLRYALRGHDFLRIEGHLGKNVRDVMSTLLSYRSGLRLPFEVVALRTGAFDEDMEVDLEKEECRFEDLDTLYATLTSELRCFVVKQVQYFFDLPTEKLTEGEPRRPSFRIVREIAPDWRVRPGTVGWLIEANLTWRRGKDFVGFVERRDAPRPLDERDEVVVTARADSSDVAFNIFALTSAMNELAEQVPDDMRSFSLDGFAERYHRLVAVAEQFDAARRKAQFDPPWLSDRVDDIVYRCRLDPMEALTEEYRRRIRDVKQAQFLSHYARHHPGLQHAGGVPLGGTFVVVYHGSPGEVRRPVEREDRERLAEERLADERVDREAEQPVEESGVRDEPVIDPRIVSADERRRNKAIEAAVAKLRYKRDLAKDPDLQEIYRAVMGRTLVPKATGTGKAPKIYLAAVRELTEGAVVADFFLPYQCCSHCSPIQYTLPQVRLRMDVSLACTDANGQAEATVSVEGASGAVSVKVDDQAFRPLTGSVVLTVGEHTLTARDSAGVETEPTTVAVPPALVIGDPAVTVGDNQQRYQVAFEVGGGTPPYAVDPGTLNGSTYTSPLVRIDRALEVTVKDAAGCAVSRTFESGVDPCVFPCGGEAIRRGHRFWIPPARRQRPLNDYRVGVRRFVLTREDGSEVDLTRAVGEAFDHGASPIRAGDFVDVVGRWLEKANAVVADALGVEKAFVLDYEPATRDELAGTLWIDRPRCFGLQLALEAAYEQDQSDHRVAVVYDEVGTRLQTESSSVLIPPFDGSTSNRCESEDQVPICEDSGIRVEVAHEQVRGGIELIAKVARGNPAAFLWEIPGAQPELANGEHIAVRLEPSNAGLPTVQLTVFDEKGCTTRVEHSLEQG